MEMAGKPMNLALYVEWKNQEHKCWRKGSLETLSDVEEKRDVTKNADFHISSDCMKHGSIVLKEVL